ncbi:hypothetical protein FIM12_04830 [SAR202 cluster bacterium AD-804-J14_MRT_500m]|nr:hypothetical protein [SAR202 cluster bacterium AD-804-J14_MRT_500m]
MPTSARPETKQALIEDLTARAVSLYGAERALYLKETIHDTASRLAIVGSNLPHFEEVPSLTWHNHP